MDLPYRGHKHKHKTHSATELRFADVVNVKAIHRNDSALSTDEVFIEIGRNSIQ